MTRKEYEAYFRSLDFEKAQLAGEAWDSWTEEERETATVEDIERDIADTLQSIEEQRNSGVHEVVAEIKATLTTQDIDDIMVSALEGGVTSCWCGDAEVVEEKRVAEWGHEQIARGGVLVLHDIEDPDEKWELNLEKFLKGFKLWIENGGDEYGAVQKSGTVDCGEIDAECADAIVQYALFGELTFG